MKILIVSFAFLPNIGGIERFGDNLATQFVAMGHDVRVVTPVTDPDNLTAQKTYKIIRSPNKAEAIELHRWCDICLHSGISLQMIRPLLFVRRPWVIVHHTWLRSMDGKVRRVDHLKQFLLRFGHSVSMSQALADHLSVPSAVIGHPYDAKTFRLLDNIDRSKDIIFVGRLVHDKGVDILIRALAKMKGKRNLTIVGPGESRDELEELTRELGLTDQVHFSGPVRGEQLNTLLNEHRVIAIPSRWAEPFGAVALEGVAAGCIAVGSSEGGLSDAIGKCGITVPNGNVDELAAGLERALTDPILKDQVLKNKSEHLAKFLPNAVAKGYIDIFKSLLPKSPANSA